MSNYRNYMCFSVMFNYYISSTSTASNNYDFVATTTKNSIAHYIIKNDIFEGKCRQSAKFAEIVSSVKFLSCKNS